MRIKAESFCEVLSPRCTVLISTIDSQGRPNAAPFSFVTPVSSDPPLVLFAAAPRRHTLANVRMTGEFVLNMVPERLLDQLWVCSKAFPEGVSEIKESGLTERKSTMVKPPGIAECVGWIECRMEFEKEAGDHILVVGKVVHAECPDEVFRNSRFDISLARPVMHIRSTRFAIADRIVEPRVA